MQLRGYQAAMVEEVQAAWNAGARNVGAVLPTGGGKTVVFGHVLHEHPGAACAIAHRRELVGQMSTTLARLDVRHRIIAPLAAIKEIVTLHVRATGRSYHDPHARIGVAGVDTLGRRDLAAWEAQVSLWVCDECFPAGTLVDGQPIENLQVGDWVTAFDEKTGAFAQRQVTRIFRRVMPKHMVRVVAGGHHVVEATREHPFWTQRGWVLAKNLHVGDAVLTHGLHGVRNDDFGHVGASEVPISENQPGILQQKMRDDLPRKTTDCGVESSGQTSPDSTVLCVRANSRPFGVSTASVRDNRASLLQPRLCASFSESGVVRNSDPNQPAIRSGTNAVEQPHANRSDPSKSIRVSQNEGSSTEYPRGERAGRADTRTDSFSAIRELGLRGAAGYPNGPMEEKPRRLTLTLPTGFGELCAKTGDRGGRDQSRGASSFRREKRPFSRWVRVDRVEIHERPNTHGNGASDCSRYVYNIEVDGFHTYVANGFVVHNCHHLLAKNKWGKALSLFPNARGLGVTATPVRADGKGLGRHADGLLDALVVGPDMRTLIEQGFLTDYRVFAPQSDIDLASVPVSDTTGDFSPPALREAARRSHIVGDIVDTYLRLAPGLLGITFCVSVDLAAETAARYRDAGVAAECVSADTPDLARAEILRRFARREIMQLVNVDLFGEGFDVPAVEVISMGRPTQSYGLYSQQFGRALRPLAGKTHALVIDHVGNVLRHGLPDAPRVWSLDRRERRKANTTGPTVKVCPACAGVFERVFRECPYCGHVPEPVLRVAPAHVDGDLLELDAAVLARLRGEAARIGDAPMIPRGASPEVRGAIIKRHRELQAAQARLRDRIAWWAGWQRALGRSDHEGYRRFYLDYGVDVATAQTLRTREATALADRVDAALAAAGVRAGLPGIAA